MSDLRSLLPPDLRHRLLQGSCGELHLASLAEAGLAGLGDDPALAPRRLALYGDMLLAAWEQSPWDNGKAALLLDLEKVRPFLPPPVRVTLRALARQGASPSPAALPAALWDALVEADAPGSPNLTNSTAPMALMAPPYPPDAPAAPRIAADAFAAELERTALPPALRARLAADAWLLSAGSDHQAADAERAAALYRTSFEALPLPETLFRLASALIRSGDREEAARALRGYLRLRPWSVHGLLRLHDLVFGLDRPGPPPEGRGAALFYTWNRADSLDAALASVAAGDTPPPVIILDNGSTDATPELVRAWKDRLGDSLAAHRVPVNIGAPAARNWLMQLPETAGLDWLAYMDDDALLPPDWLGHFGTAMRACPGAGVYGCRVVEHARPWHIQSADLHLMDGDHPGLPPAGGGARFLVSDLHHQTPDFGTFTYLRPCVSVTGCAHLFTRRALDETGPFGLAFSPSQYDDLERDLRAARAGKLAVYTGHLRVRHVQRTGGTRRKWPSPATTADALGHFFKLRLLYGPEDITAVRRRDAEAAEADLRRKEAALADFLAEPDTPARKTDGGAA